MEIEKIRVKNELCTKCGKCAKVCLDNVLCQKEKKGAIDIVDSTQCKLCGNCITICRRNAISVEGIHIHRRKINDQIRMKGFAFSLILFPIMLLTGFLMHPNLLQMKMVITSQDLVERFHNNMYFHMGHLIVMFAVPLIIVSMVGIMNLLQHSGKGLGLYGGIIGVFGAFILAVDKGALCLVLSAFDALPEAEFLEFAPFLQVIVDKSGLLKICYLLPLLPIGAVIQAIGMIKEKFIKRWQGVLMIIGLLLLNNPDIELISSIGAILICFGYFPIARKVFDNDPITR